MKNTTKNAPLFKLVRNQDGSVVPMFAITAVLLFGMAGGAIDYSRMSTSQADFQEAADAAALAAAINMRKESWQDSKKHGRKVFRENLESYPNVDLDKVTIKRTGEDRQTIKVTARGTAKTFLLGVMGIKELKFEVSSVVNTPEYPVEIAMVLDNTFSMTAGNKIGTLRSTANDFVDAMYRHDYGDIKISIVPFAQYVNVGRNQLGQPWLDARDETITVPEQCTTQQDIISKSGCTTSTTTHPRQWIPESCTGPTYNDGVQVSPGGCTPGYWRDEYTSTSESCSNITYGEPYEQCTPEYSYTIEWQGCVGSRDEPFNLNDGNYGKRVPGLNNVGCPTPITPLTDNKSTLRSAINSMTANGNTYIPQGVTWGYRTLTKKRPFSEAMSDNKRKNENGKRYMIVMTDGVNFSSPLIPSSPKHDGSDIAKSDNYLEQACKEAKKEEIIIYTIAFGTDVDDDTKDLLIKCATEPKYYFNATTNGNLKESFEAIADDILKVYISS